MVSRAEAFHVGSVPGMLTPPELVNMAFCRQTVTQDKTPFCNQLTTRMSLESCSSTNNMATLVVDSSNVPSPTALWLSLSEVEKTCLQVAFVRWAESHRKWPDGKPWYEDPYGALWVGACIPEEQQARMKKWKEQGDRIADVMAVRTAEIDSRIRSAVWGNEAGAKGTVPQLVIVGAGADTRAWRLSWPAAFKLFEVDSSTVLGFKSRVLDAAGPVFRETLKVDRVEVVADAAQPEDMWAKLVTAGLDPSRPVFWLLEGLLGYLPLDAGNDLLSTMQHHSHPGSHIIVTVPPGPAVKAAKDKAQAALQQQAAGREDSGAGGADQEHPKVEMGEGAAGGVSTVQANMPHVTFEEPQDTLSRVVKAGWGHGQLLTSEWLANKYVVQHAQPIVLARKE